MQSLLQILPPREDYPRLAIWVFLIAWIVGNGAFVLGLHGREEGLFAECFFAVACGLWWLGYKLCRSVAGWRKGVGFLALALWAVNLIAALALGFREYITYHFVWVATVILILLAIAAAIFKNDSSSHTT